MLQVADLTAREDVGDFVERGISLVLHDLLRLGQLDLRVRAKTYLSSALLHVWQTDPVISRPELMLRIHTLLLFRLLLH